MRSMLGRMGLFGLILVTLAGCSHPSSTSAATSNDTSSSTAPVTSTVKVNWFVDNDGKPVPQGYVNWEAEKQQKHIPTNLIIIHHTGDPPGMTWEKLSEIQYQRLYVPRYASDDSDPMVQGWAPHSGHYRIENGQKVEVFYAYHWLIRADGSTARLLNDDEVGWNSGNWDKNMQSIALCFDGNFIDGKPSDKALTACAKLIAQYQKKYSITDVIGHRDTFATKCPGDWWPDGKKALLAEAAKYK